jgi:hypothetical protein
MITRASALSGLSLGNRFTKYRMPVRSATRLVVNLLLAVVLGFAEVRGLVS